MCYYGYTDTYTHYIITIHHVNSLHIYNIDTTFSTTGERGYPHIIYTSHIHHYLLITVWFST
jgi:hypothetical protein